MRPTARPGADRRHDHEQVPRKQLGDLVACEIGVGGADDEGLHEAQHTDVHGRIAAMANIPMRTRIVTTSGDT
jgi:hypothetical protein